MKISLERFKKYKKIIQNILVRYNPLTESLYFNIKDGYCHFQNEEVYGRMKIEQNDQEDNIFVNGEKFLLLSSNLEDLELKDQTFFDLTGSFKLGNYGELNYEVPSYDDYEEYSEYDNLVQNKELFNSLHEAYHYIQKEQNEPYNAIFINNNHIIGSEGARIYLKKIENISDINLQESLIKLLLYLDENDQVSFKKLDNKILLNINNECEIIINRNTNLQIPAIFDHSDYYDHDTFVKCNLKEFYSLIQFLLPFTNSDNWNKIFMRIKDNSISISIKEEDINIEKSLNFLETNLKDLDSEYILCCTDLKLILTHLQGQELKIQLSSDKMIKDNYTLLCFSSIEDNNKKIILPTLES